MCDCAPYRSLLWVLEVDSRARYEGSEQGTCILHVDHVKRIWCLSPVRAAKIQGSLRIRAVSPEPSLLAHTSSESRGTFREKARSLAPLNGWACAVEICHDGMLEDTNSLDGPMRAAKVQASLRIRAVSPEPSLLAHTSSESRGTFREKARSLAPLNGWACAVKICHDGMLEDTNSLDGAHVCRKGFIPCKCFELYERAAKVLARLRACAGWPEPSLLA